MANSALTKYIKAELSDGTSKTTIVATLKKEGWSSVEIEEAYKSAKDISHVPVPVPAESEESSSKVVTLLSVGDIISISINMFKERFWTYVGIVAFGWLLIGASFLIIGIVAVIFVLLGSTYEQLIGLLVLIGIPLGLIAFFMVILISFWPQIALVMCVIKHKEKLSVMNSYKRTKHLLLSSLWIGIISLLIIYGGLTLFIIPGIIVGVWLIFSTYVLLDQDKHGLEALKTSRLLVKGNWWGIFGRIGLLVVLYYVVYIFIWALIFGLLGETYGEIVYQLLSIVINLIVSPIIVIYYFVLYKNLREMKDPIDTKQDGSGKYIGLGVVGLFLPLLSILLMAALIAVYPASQMEKAKDLQYYQDTNQKYESSDEQVETDLFQG